MKKLLFCCCIAISCTIELFAQGGVDKIEPTAAKGTFQLVFDSENAPAINVSQDVLRLIESKREDSRENIIVLNEHVKVRILSKNQISSGAFIPIEEEYIVKPELFNSTKH